VFYQFIKLIFKVVMFISSECSWNLTQ